MGRTLVISFVGVVLVFLLICETTKAQTQFTIIESNETVDVGNITAVGSGFRFDSPPCPEIFTIDDRGAIRTTKGIDRESSIIENNTDTLGWLSCTVAYLTSDGNNGTQRIQVAIADINDNAPEFVGLTGISVQESTTVNQIVTVFTVRDPDNGDNGTIDGVVLSGMDKRFFNLMPSRVGELFTVHLHAKGNIDFEMYQQLNITLTAMDRGTPPRTSSSEVTITVEDVNDNAPVFSPSDYQFKDVVDTTPSDVPIGSVSATDNDGEIFGIVLYSITSTSGLGASCGNPNEMFTINSTTGAIYLSQSAIGRRCAYTIRVKASNGGNTRGDNGIVHVSIIAAVLVFVPQETNYTITEERKSELFFWTVQEGTNFSIEMIPNNSFSLSYVPFDFVISSGISFTFNFTDVDREQTPVISGTLTVYSDAPPNEPPLPGTLNFYFTVLDINDNQPVFETTNFSIPENSHVGYKIGPIVAVDPDEGENSTVTYELLDSTHEDLVTLYSNGSLVVSDAIDYEQVEVIELFVKAQDQGTPPMYQNESIYINIVNLNDELPEFSGNFDQRVLTTDLLPLSWNVTATDNDKGEYGEVEFRKIVTATPNDASTFVTLVDAVSGQLRIEELPKPSSIPYQLVVEAVDRGNGTSRITINIEVWTDICNDNPCRNGGTCTNEDNSYKCECTEKYGGRNCSILKNPCVELPTNPCLNDGSCRNTEDELDYHCTCTDDFSGKNCSYSTVSFKPRSFQIYRLPGVSANSRDLQVSVHIAPKFLNGLLLYVEEGDNFISIELEDGRVVMRTPHVEISNDDTMVTTNGMWYLISMIMKSGTEPSVNVSEPSNDLDITNSNRFPSEEQLDDVTGTVFIGGLSGDPTIYRHVRNPDYVGCMRDLFVNGKRVLLFEEDQRRLRSHNVEKGCTLDSSRSCGTECTKEGCIDFLSNSSVPYCDCILPLSNCTAGVPTTVGFTGQANLIAEAKDDFFIAIQQSRHKLKATEPDVEQVVSFSFRSTTEEAVLLSATVESSLRVFWFGNGSLNYDIYEGDTRCGRVSVIGIFDDNDWYHVKLTVKNNNNVILVVDDGHDPNDTMATLTCQSNLFVEFPSSAVTITGTAMHLSTKLPNRDFQGCISDLIVDEITVPLAKDYLSDLVTLLEVGRVDEVHNECEPNLENVTGEEEDAHFFQLYIIVIIAVVAILVLVVITAAVIWFGRRCLRRRPNKSQFDMSQEMPDVYQDSPPSTLNFRKKTEFDNASVGHYQEEGEETMPDATAISIDSLRKSACNSSGSGGTGSSAETGFHTGSERDHISDAGYPEPSTMMVNDETPSEVQESEYSTFISDSDITSAVEQTLSPLDVQLLGPPNVLNMPPPPQARNMSRKPSPSMKDPAMLPMERKISPFHSHNRFSMSTMSTIESGSESSLGPPPPPDPILSYPHPSSMQHEPQLPGLKTLCGPDFNPISYWEQQSRLKPSIDPDYPLQRLSLASGRGTEDPSSTVSIASTLEEQHEFASQGGGEGEATNMRDGLESDHELDYRLADLHIPEYESMTLSQSTIVGGTEEYFPDATVKPCHPLVPVHDNSVSSNSPYHSTLPDHLHSPQSLSSTSTGYGKNSHQKLLSEQDLSTHDRYYGRSRTGASRPSHMISDHRLHAQYSSSSTSSASTPQTRRAWRSEDPINV